MINIGRDGSVLAPQRNAHAAIAECTDRFAQSVARMLKTQTV